MSVEPHGYLELKNLEVYQLARAYSRLGWQMYKRLDWQMKKIIGDQMIESIDSVGANIAEGYGRFHYLDKNKFYYNARGSLLESKHWIGLLHERGYITVEEFRELKNLSEQIPVKLNGLIKAQYKRNQ